MWVLWQFSFYRSSLYDIYRDCFLPQGSHLLPSHATKSDLCLPLIIQKTYLFVGDHHLYVQASHMQKDKGNHISTLSIRLVTGRSLWISIFWSSPSKFRITIPHHHKRKIISKTSAVRFPSSKRAQTETRENTSLAQTKEKPTGWLDGLRRREMRTSKHASAMQTAHKKGLIRERPKQQLLSSSNCLTLHQVLVVIDQSRWSYHVHGRPGHGHGHASWEGLWHASCEKAVFWVGRRFFKRGQLILLLTLKLFFFTTVLIVGVRSIATIVGTTMSGTRC